MLFPMVLHYHAAFTAPETEPDNTHNRGIYGTNTSRNEITFIAETSNAQEAVEVSISTRWVSTA